MSTPHYRAPGMRWPIPRALTLLAIAVLGLSDWLLSIVLEEEQRLEAMFQPEADIIQRVRSAEVWAAKGKEALPHLKQALASPDPSTRYIGLLSLAYMPREHARPVLPEVIRLCEDPSPRVQADALVLAATLSETPEDIAPLIASRLTSPHVGLHQAAFSALEKLGGAATPAIADVCRDAEPGIQVKCLQLLLYAAMDEETGFEAASVIAEYLRSPAPNVRVFAYKYSALIRPVSPDEIARALVDPQRGIVSVALQEWNLNPVRESEAFTQLLDLLNRRSSPQVQVLEAIAAHGPSDRDLFDRLSPWTDSKDPEIRRAAVAALARGVKNAEQTRPVLVRRLADPDPEVAQEAARRLAEISSSELPGLVRDVLLPRLDAEEETVRISAAAALSGMPEAAASEKMVLIRLLDGDSVSSKFKFRLVEALGHIGPPAQEAVPAILKLIRQTPAGDPRLKIALSALGKIGDDRPAVLETLNRLYGQPELRRSPVMPVLIETLSRLAPEDRRVFDRITDSAIEGGSVQVRVAALRALTRFRLDPEAVQGTYVLALDDPSPNVRLAACLLATRDGGSEDIVREMTHLLKDDNQFVSIVAAHQLGRLGAVAEEAVPALHFTAEDTASRFFYSILDWEGYEDVESVKWDLFDEETRSLKRTSLQRAARAALAAIEQQPGRGKAGGSGSVGE